MKLSELLVKMDGVESYGLYFQTRNGSGAYSPKDDIPNCEIKDVVKYLDYEVKDFRLGIFDGPNETKYIRVCIHLYI